MSTRLIGGARSDEHTQSILAPDHARILRAMRAEQSLAAESTDDVEERDLAVYDRITEVA